MATASGSTPRLVGESTVRQRHERDTVEVPASALSGGPGADYNEIQIPMGKPLRRRRIRAKKGQDRIAGPEGWIQEGFRRFGEHCARNQIRTLLIDCLVMTNLFYPSLALYLQRKFPPLHPPSPPSHNTHRIPLQRQAGRRRVKKEHPLSLLSTPVLDSFFPYPPPLLPRLRWSGWWGRDTGQKWPGEDEWSMTPVNYGQEIGQGVTEGAEEIRLMRIGWADVGHVLDRDDEGERGRDWQDSDGVLLGKIWDMAESWERDNAAFGERCVRQLGASSDVGKEVQAVGPCYLVTGDDYLNYGDIPLVPLPTLTSSAIVTEDTASVPVGWDPNAGHIYHSVAVLFHVPRNSSSSFESRWVESVAQVSKQVQGEVFVEAQGTRGGAGDQIGEWHLTHTSMPSYSQSTLSAKAETVSPLPANAVLFLYIALLGILLAQLSNATKVHSRFGLAFTGVVQLMCSAVMSFSVVALSGWNGWGSSQDETTLPSYVLPFVIVVVGVDNMSTLTKAVFSVPFDYSVPVRIGLGLSRAGLTIALTSLTDVIVLGLVWLFVNIRPVREFCVFACVVIITDWFMLHTFFLTVLSIDAQRLELADVLAPPASSPSGPKQVPVVGQDEIARTSKLSWRGILRARTAKSGSLILLLVSVGLLYYFTESTRSSNSTASLYGYNPASSTTTSVTSATPSPTTFITTVADLLDLSAPQRLWRSMNPRGWPFIRISVPAASIIVLPRAGHQMLPKDIRKLAVPSSRLLLPRLKPLFYLFKVVILPQAVTAGALYALLLYLLKDSELLDAQRNKQGRRDPSGNSELNDTLPGLPSSSKSVSNIMADMLPCSHESDIDIIASSPDGKMVISIGLDNAICLWRFIDGQAGSGTRETVKHGLPEDDPISAACISDDGQWIAVGTSGAAVQIWKVGDDGELEAMPLRRIQTTSGIDVISFDKEQPEDDLFSTTLPSSDIKTPSLLVGMRDGSVHSFTGTETAEFIPKQSGQVLRIVVSISDKRLSFLISGPDGTFTWTQRGSKWTPLRLKTPISDPVTAVSQSTITQYDISKCLTVIGFKSGRVEVFDTNGDSIATIGQATPSSDAIRKVDLVSVDSTRCSGCSTTSSEGYFVISSTRSHTYIDRIQPHSIPFCRCAAPTIRRGSVVEDPLKLNLTSPTRLSPGRPSFSQTLFVAPSPMRRFSPGASPKKSPSLLPPPSNGEFPLSSHGVRRSGGMERERSKDDSDISGTTRTLSPSPSGNGLSLNISSPMAGRSASNSSTLSSSSNGTYLSTYVNGHSVETEEMDVIPLGAVLSQSGGWSYLPSSGRLMGVRRTGLGVDDSQWQVWTVDLRAPWNGTTLNGESIPLNTTIDRTRRSSLPHRVPAQPLTPQKSVTPSNAHTPEKGISMKDRRAERLLSLNGRATFPSPSPTGSFSVPTHPTLAYVSVRPIVRRGDAGLVAGFGNRLGVISFTPDQTGSGSAPNTASGRRGFGLTPPPPQGGRRLNPDSLDSAKKVN